MTEDKVDLCHRIAEYFDGLPAGSIDQKCGLRTRHCSACAGAHLDAFFNPGNQLWFASWGSLLLMQALKMDQEDLSSVLHNLGAPLFPWGTVSWEVPPAEVFKRLAVWFIENQK